jgi:hypothetical protein
MRAFHIMDPKGVLDTLLVFHEKRQGSEVPQSIKHHSVGTTVSLVIVTLKPSCIIIL